MSVLSILHVASRAIVWHKGSEGTDVSRMLNLSHGGNRSHRCLSSRDASHIDFRSDLTASVLLRAVARNVTSLTALVASLASSVQRAAVRGGTVARNVTELAAGVALHSLSLAIPSKVVGTTALVAGSRTRTAREPAASSEAAGKSAASHGSTTTHRANRIRARALGMTCQQWFRPRFTTWGLRTAR